MAEQETYAVRVHRGDEGSLWAEASRRHPGRDQA
jgi:hypothetical protein